MPRESPKLPLLVFNDVCKCKQIHEPIGTLVLGSGGNERSPTFVLVTLEWVILNLSSRCWVGGNTYMRQEWRQKPITPPSLVPVHNKLSHRSGDNYLSHIIKHLEQIGGSNYRLPSGYPSPFIVLPPYITWWDLLCCAFSCAILFAPCLGGGYIDKRGLMARCTPSKSFVIFFPACTLTWWRETKVSLPWIC